MHYEVVNGIETALRAEADHVYQWSNGPRFHYAAHSHPYRKILYVEQGSITFLPAGQAPIELNAGDRLDLAPGATHTAVVGDDGVVCWEGQAKAR